MGMKVKFFKLGENKTKRAKKSIMNNPNTKCHSCNKLSKNDLTKCDQTNCDVYFCNRCIKKYDQPFTTCYVCLKLCKCDKCMKEEKIKNEAVGKNIIKIDDFEIIEDDEDQPWTRYDCDEATYNKMISHITNVEGYKPHGGKINKICLICNLDRLSDCGMYKFKSLEEFLYYCKYFYGQDDIKFNEDYIKSNESFQKIFSDFLKYYHCDYNFKSIKFICRECFTETLKSEKGFNDIYNSLHVGTNAQYRIHKKKTESATNINEKSPDEIKTGH